VAGNFARRPDGFSGRLGPGSLIAGYLIEEQVGAGGMAVVFRARDEVLGRFAAVKVIAPVMAGDDEFRARFLRESRAVAAVDSPHIIPVYAAGEAEGLLYIATRFVAGGDLATQLRRAGGRFPPERVAPLVLQVGSALDAAHAAGLVHRDVKPGNILVDIMPGRPEHAYLSDFGLSKGTESSTGLTASGQFVGTPDYCAPEQIRSSHVDGRTDQYALACVAFALLIGTPPFHRSETIATLFAHLQDPVPTVTRLQPELLAGVDHVIARALAKSPAERYGSCGEFAAALRDALVSTRSQPPGPNDVNSGTIASHPSHAAARHEDLAYASTLAGVKARQGNVTAPVPGESRRTGHHRRKAALIGGIAAAVLATAGIITALTLPSSHDRATLSSPPPPSATAASQPATAVSQSGSGIPVPGMLKPIGDQTFNPYGAPPGNTENQITAPYAIDGSLTTAWSTAAYFNSPEFGGLKPGAGLLVDMEKPVTLSSATVILGKFAGTDIRIEVGNSDVASQGNLSSFITVAERADASGTCTFPAKVKARGRYILIWLTKLPLTNTKLDGMPIYQASVYNIVLRGSV
jgi:serine/threonine-protein kinase